jgi:hypothetical protein
MNFLANVWDFFLAVLWPYAGDRSALGRSRPALRYFVHYVLLAVALGIVFYLNRRLQLPGLLAEHQWAKDIWMPMLFLLLYGIALTGWWIYVLLVAPAEPTFFPDIDEAWEEAVQTLDQAGISLTETPLFLVLGRPESPEETLFQGSGINWLVKQAPVGGRHPLHVYANRDVIFVTCAGASLLGRQAALLSLENISEGEAAGGETGGAVLGGDDENKTLKPGAEEIKIIKKIAKMIGTAANGHQRRAMRRESGLAMPNLLANTAEVELHTSRFAHFCRLVTRDRAPLCPINGILLLAPLGVTDTDIDAQRSADLLSRDLSVARQELKVQCTIIGLLVDVDQVPGFDDFLSRRSASERNRRVGQRFPLNPPDLDEDTYGEKLHDSVRWMTDHVVRDLVYRSFKVEAKISINDNLYLFLDDLRQRKDRLSRFLVQGITRDADGPPWFAGCYMAGTGADKEHDQGFVRGVLQRLLESQEFVAWTDRAVAEDARAARIAFFGYVLLFLAVVAAGGGAAYWYMHR